MLVPLCFLPGPAVFLRWPWAPAEFSLFPVGEEQEYADEHHPEPMHLVVSVVLCREYAVGVARYCPRGFFAAEFLLGFLRD